VDIAIQEAGSAEAALLLAAANGSATLTDVLQIGRVLVKQSPTDRIVAEYFAANQYKPANSIAGSLAGIDYWIIETDFIVQ
jgi:hypothetical protein